MVDTRCKRCRIAVGLADARVYPALLGDVVFCPACFKLVEGAGQYFKAEIKQMVAKQAGHPAFKQLLDDMWSLHCKKAADYGIDDDPLQNIRAGADLVGIPHWQGAMLRANDKVVRIKQFIKKGTLENEGVEDSLQDLAAYALLALVLLREGKKSNGPVSD